MRVGEGERREDSRPKERGREDKRVGKKRGDAEGGKEKTMRGDKGKQAGEGGKKSVKGSEGETRVHEITERRPG